MRAFRMGEPTIGSPRSAVSQFYNRGICRRLSSGGRSCNPWRESPSIGPGCRPLDLSSTPMLAYYVTA